MAARAIDLKQAPAIDPAVVLVGFPLGRVFPVCIVFVNHANRSHTRVACAAVLSTGKSVGAHFVGSQIGIGVSARNNIHFLSEGGNEQAVQHVV